MSCKQLPTSVRAAVNTRRGAYVQQESARHPGKLVSPLIRVDHPLCRGELALL